MGTSHTIRPASQTQNPLLDTTTYCRSHYELYTASFYEYMDFTCNKPDAPIRLSHTQRGRETETVKTEQ